MYLQSTESETETFGTYKGTILRSQLIVLLKLKVNCIPPYFSDSKIKIVP